jgi:CheY-like chemotaxis protein
MLGSLLPSLSETLRAACVEARSLRQRAETVAGSLAGTVASGNGSLARPRVLVVDDAEDNRELVSVVLEHAGFETLTASDGLEGVIVAHYSRPEIIVMDVSMPVLNGIDAARLLKASAVTNDLRLIAYTARPDFEEIAFNGLFVDVLKKPALPATIVEVVERFTRRNAE